MKISDLLFEDTIITELKAVSKKEALEELADRVIRHIPNLSKDKLLNILIERENLGSTGIGEGVAIPHGKYKEMKEPILGFGKSTKGIDFDAIDGKPVHLIFILLAPDNATNVHLKTLAKIAKISKNSSLRKRLMEANSPEEIYRDIVENEEDID
ncbi:MAG TPA: PTS sugar transporter subunit IIA [Desulfobacteraceae bacterium]|nr:PTS sugar transporter subunit IIA [Desulfobacteraceae bacterium]